MPMQSWLFCKYLRRLVSGNFGAMGKDGDLG